MSRTTRRELPQGGCHSAFQPERLRRLIALPRVQRRRLYYFGAGNSAPSPIGRMDSLIYGPSSSPPRGCFRTYYDHCRIGETAGGEIAWSVPSSRNTNSDSCRRASASCIFRDLGKGGKARGSVPLCQSLSRSAGSGQARDRLHYNNGPRSIQQFPDRIALVSSSNTRCGLEDRTDDRLRLH